MKNLLIIGARGYGREVYNAVTMDDPGIRIKGFLDDKPDSLDAFHGYPSILSSVEDYIIEENDIFFCALGDNYYRLKYISIIKEKGGIFPPIINSSSIIHATAKIGQGVCIGAFCTISSDVVIGDYTNIFPYSTIGHDAVVGTNCTIGNYGFMGGYSQIGDNVTLHTRSTILPHKKVGEGAVVGAGSVVIRNVKPGTIVFGNPAREI